MSEVKHYNNLKLAREQSGKTQAQVANEVGSHPRVYQKYEYGEAVPSVKVGLRIAKALGTTVEELWGVSSNIHN